MVSQHFILPALLPRDKAIERLATVFKGLSLDRAWRVSVGEHKPSRSAQQNRYLWGIIYPTILKTGNLAGWDLADIHEYLLGEWSGWEVLEGFGKKRMKPVRRSSALNKEEFSAYVDFIQRKMAEIGVFIPDADKSMAA